MRTDKERKQLELLKNQVPQGATMARDIIPDDHAPKGLESITSAQQPVVGVTPASNTEIEKARAAVATLGGTQQVAQLGRVLRQMEEKKAPLEFTDITPRPINRTDMEAIMRNEVRVGARPSCKRCNGRGVYGYKSGTNIPLLCSCTRITGVRK